MRLFLGISLAVLSGCLHQSSTPTSQQWVEGLAGSDGVVCFARLRQASEGEVDGAILAGVRHPNPRVRAQCARLLGLRQDITLAVHLEKLLDDADTGVRQQAARGLVPLLDSQELLQKLQSPQLSVVAKGSLASAMLRDHAELAEPGFVQWLLKPTHPQNLRVYLYQAIREHHSPHYGDNPNEKALLPGVQHGRSILLRQAQLDAESESQPTELRASALLLYATLGGPPSLPHLTALYANTQNSYRLRESALVAMGSCGNPQSVNLLIQVAEDNTLPISLRQSAMMGLQQLPGQPRVLESLLGLLKHPESRIRLRAARALENLKSQEAVQPLKEALNQELDEDARAQMRCSLRVLDSRSPSGPDCLPHP